VKGPVTKDTWNVGPPRNSQELERLGYQGGKKKGGLGKNTWDQGTYLHGGAEVSGGDQKGQDGFPHHRTRNRVW